MEADSTSKNKSALLAMGMLTFALIAVFGGVAIGDEQPNVEVPVLDISKTVISGDFVVPEKTRVYWELEIEVSYDDETGLSDVTVKDTLPSELELINTTVSKGSAGILDKKGAIKLIWEIGTMSAGDTETLRMWIATAQIPSKSSVKYHFGETGEYELNSGAHVSGNHETGKITAGPTDPITVSAI